MLANIRFYCNAGDFDVDYYAGSFIEIAGGLTKGTYYYLKISDINFTNHTYDLEIFNMSDVSQDSINDGAFQSASADNVDDIFFDPDSAVTVDFRFDDIKVVQ